MFITFLTPTLHTVRISYVVAYVYDACEFHMLLRDARPWTAEQKKKK